jgi:hypothetical protein
MTRLPIKPILLEPAISLQMIENTELPVPMPIGIQNYLIKI